MLVTYLVYMRLQLTSINLSVVEVLIVNQYGYGVPKPCKKCATGNAIFTMAMLTPHHGYSEV